MKSKKYFIKQINEDVSGITILLAFLLFLYCIVDDSNYITFLFESTKCNWIKPFFSILLDIHAHFSKLHDWTSNISCLLEENYFDMFTFQIGLIFGGSAIFGHILYNNDKRIVCSSVKLLIMKKYVYRYFNQTTCYVLASLLTLFSLLSFLFHFVTTLFLCFIATLLVFARVLWFIYIFDSKVSFFYNKLMILLSNTKKNKQKNELVSKVLEKMERHHGPREKQYNSYIQEELIVTFLLHQFELQNNPNDTTALANINQYAKDLIISDGRNVDDIIKIVIKEKKEYFVPIENKDIESWLNKSICNNSENEEPSDISQASEKQEAKVPASTSYVIKIHRKEILRIQKY